MQTIPIDELSGKLGLTPDQLKRRWRRMHRASGFPAPLYGSVWVWSRPAVERWAEAGAAPVVVHSFNDNAPLAELTSLQRLALQERYK